MLQMKEQEESALEKQNKTKQKPKHNERDR